MRELLAVFGGNEIALGLMLASWLLWTAAGSAIFGRAADRVRRPRLALAALEALTAIALPLTIQAIRTSKTALEIVPGESLGPAAVLLVSLGALSAFCFASGASFAAAGKLCAEDAGCSNAEATGAVYVCECLGSAAGGLLAGVALVRFFSAFQIACLLGALNLEAAAYFALRSGRLRLAVAAALAAFAYTGLFPAATLFETRSLAHLWPGYRLLATRNSAYGNLAVVEGGGLRSFYENGLLEFHAPDPEGAEEAVHYALLEAPAPRRVLMIGGGMNGSLAQALEHPSIQRIDYVEMDPAALELASQYFSETWKAAWADERIHIHVTDGRLFLQSALEFPTSKLSNGGILTFGSAPLIFDAIIVNLPEPQTAQLNRYYTEEFFREVSAKLTSAGVLSFGLPASETYISPERAEFLQTILKTLRAVFPDVAILPGETVHFFAARRAGILVRDADSLLERLRARGVETAYVREYYLPFRMSPERVAALEKAIAPRLVTRINQDFAPSAYYFDTVLWTSRFGRLYSSAMRSLAGVGFGWLLAAASGISVFILGFARFAKAGRESRTAACCTWAMGFTLIGLEVLLFLAFQAAYGSVYQRLAILIGAFMAGMTLGSWRAMRASASIDSARRSQAWSQATAAAAPLAAWALLSALPHLSPWAGQAALFTAAFLCGAMGGFQFPVASRIFFSDGGRGMGALYALDLAGSCVGALLFSAYLIPVAGFMRTALLAAVVNLGPAVAAAAAAREHRVRT